ncbi:MAG TPA: DUF896 domain-containing protein [Candidatus Enterenecus merdae]|nr:DUF896 domain-containing protein [Candidatus Enterenecus merdae]
MDQAKIDRINDFARRVKAGETLTPQELAERDALRREYVDSVKANLVSQLEHTYLVEPDGTKHKLPKKPGRP